ncbi:MAG TPA: hypothetical protein PLZ42_00800 [Methanothrix sp.]|mgnify:FL=1|nr:hypothetical protein [Methanothrix sp.]
MVAIEIDQGSLMIAAAGAMTSALLTLIFSYLAFRVSIESRLKDLEHQAESLMDLDEAFLTLDERMRDLEEALGAQEERIGGLEMVTGGPEAHSDEKSPGGEWRNQI